MACIVAFAYSLPCPTTFAIADICLPHPVVHRLIRLGHHALAIPHIGVPVPAEVVPVVILYLSQAMAEVVLPRPCAQGGEGEQSLQKAEKRKQKKRQIIDTMF